MGLRFRKSIKIAPGLKLNTNSKSVSVTAGTKGAHYTINSNGRKTASVGIPGTGISYSESTGGSKKTGSPHKGGGGGGCLLTCLKILLAICVFALAAAFAWIPGAIWLIFFRKKIEDTDKQKKYTILVSIISVLSLLFFIYSMATGDSNKAPDDHPTEISSELTTEPATELTTEPVSEIPEETEQPESEVSSTDSEQTTVTPSSDSEQTDVASSEPATDVPSDSTVETPVSEPSEPEQTDNAEAQTDNSSAADNSAVADTPAVDSQQDLVWVDDTADKYHRKPNCSGMDNAYQVTREQAEAMSKAPCKKCFR